MYKHQWEKKQDGSKVCKRCDTVQTASNRDESCHARPQLSVN